MTTNALAVVSLLGLAFVTIWTLQVYRTAVGDRLRVASALSAAMTSTIIIAGALRLYTNEIGVSETAGNLVTIFNTSLVTVVSIIGLRTLPRTVVELKAVEVMVETLTKRLDTQVISDLGLTPRELEVVEIMATGVVDDAGIAEALSISPATAGTHVRNVMSKARVSDRRDLLLLRRDS